MGIRSGKGDAGFTDLLFNRRISKDSADILAIGDLDELNSYLGLIKNKSRSRKDRAILEKIQHGICVIASEIAVGTERKKKLGPLLQENDTDWIKLEICNLENGFHLERCFSLPGGSELSSFLDIARAVARRAERSVVSLLNREKVKNKNALSYLNCVSDILFIMAREKETCQKKRTRSRKTRKKRGKK